jgi:septal ring factor EnvC (AmiA/AmiB activator)
MAVASSNLVAWVAVAITTGGGILTTAIHYGSTNQQIATIEDKQNDVAKHIAKHDDQLLEIQKAQAANAQQLKDIADTVHDMRDNGVKRK